MRKVLFKRFIEVQWDENKKRVAGTGRLEDDYHHAGTFHQWGSDIVEDDRGFSSFTVAIIELADGTIEQVIPTRVKFIT